MLFRSLGLRRFFPERAILHQSTSANTPRTAAAKQLGDVGVEARELSVKVGGTRVLKGASIRLRRGTVQALVAAGLAYVLPAEPHYTVDPVLLEAQRQAMRRGEGIWARIQRRPVSLTGNRRSRRFHRADTACAKSVGKRHGLTFADYLQAFDAGYAPCRRCFERLDELMQKEPAAQRAK